MKRPTLQHIHTTTWAVADMEVVAITDAESPGLRSMGNDIHAVIDTGSANGRILVVFFVTTDNRVIKRLRALIGKTVSIRMSGDYDSKQRFRPDTLEITREKRLRGCVFSPRARSA